uniref:Protein kinase domain-containing protein n=1 Tax=Acrobeloides nanus TaxID=290746 RepID=A0A914DEM5_9BILA
MRYYRAPEVVLNVVYDDKVDVWSVGCILAELLTGKVLFPGKDHIDQWIKIIEVLGTPGEEFLQKLPESVQHFLRLINHHEAKSFDYIFPDSVFPPMDDSDMESTKKNGTMTKIAKPRKPYCTALNGRDFLKKLLVIDPQNRISIEQALRHPYVEEKHEAGELDAKPRPILAYSGDIDSMELHTDEWKKLIFDEIKHYEHEKAKILDIFNSIDVDM